MKPHRAEERLTPHVVDRSNPVHEAPFSDILLTQIAEALPDAWCRKMRRVSFNWYRVLSNVVTRRCLSKLPLYRQEEWLRSDAERRQQSQSAHAHQRTPKLQALTTAFSQRVHRHGHACAQPAHAHVSRLQQINQAQLASMFRMVHAQREAGWRRLGLLKQRIWDMCHTMKMSGHIPAAWHQCSRHDLMFPQRLEIPWYCRRATPDTPSLLMLCIQTYEICKTLYPTEKSADRDKYGALEANGIDPLPSQLTLSFIEQLIDHALNALDPREAWTLSAPSEQARLRASIRIPVQGQEPEWDLVAHLAHADMREELAAYERVTGISIHNSLSAARLTQMMRVRAHFLPCYELLRVCAVRVREPADLARIFDHALQRCDWQIIARILRDCDSLFHTYALYANVDRREQLIGALVTAPTPTGERQARAMEQIFEALRRDSLVNKHGQPTTTFHSTCLKYLTHAADQHQPVLATLRAWEATADRVTRMIEQYSGTSQFPEMAKDLLNAVYQVPIQVAAPVLMTLIAAVDDSALYRQAIRLKLMTRSDAYPTAPHAGRPCTHASFNRNLSPLHAALQHDALNVFIETVDPAHIFEHKPVTLDGKERSLRACVTRFDAHKIQRFLEDGGIPSSFSSSRRIDAFVKSVIAAHAKFVEPLGIHKNASKEMSSNAQGALEAMEDRIAQLLRTPSLAAAKLAATLCDALESPWKEQDALALLRRLWGYATDRPLDPAPQDIVFRALRQTALRMEIQFEQHDLAAFIDSGVKQHCLSTVLAALAMPYDGLTRLDPVALIHGALPLCLAKDTATTRQNYRALNKAVAHAGLRYKPSNLDPYACELLLLRAGHILLDGRSRSRSHDVFHALAADLMPLFYASFETAGAHTEQIQEHVEKWQSLSPGARFKRTGSPGKLREEIRQSLQQIVQLRLPVSDIHTLFRGLCITNQSGLTNEVLRNVDLDLRALDQIARHGRWHCFEIILEHGAHRVFHTVTDKHGCPSHWLNLSAQRIEHALMQSKERGAAILNAALDDLSHLQLVDFFRNLIRESPDRFTQIDSPLCHVLRYQAHERRYLTKADIKQLAQLSQDLRNHDAYRTIMRATSE